jgi:hypothetical protein
LQLSLQKQTRRTAYTSAATKVLSTLMMMRPGGMAVFQRAVTTMTCGSSSMI